MRRFCSIEDLRSPVLATAIHAGHELRPAIEAHIALDDAVRLREEDPFTDSLSAVGGSSVVVHRSRFEVDLNRPRSSAVYRTPDEAWGLDLWGPVALADAEVERSLRLYDRFYARLGRSLDVLASRGPFVVLDVHSYNHRRDGVDAQAASIDDNPEVNVGTGSLDRDLWGHLVERFIDDLSDRQTLGRRLDVRENVRFRGGELSRWVHRRYAGRGCALAIEFKKSFMDEWTGEVDLHHVEELRAALASVVPALIEELSCPAPT
ncbi:MAG TPA: N-formylglutamate amidohydrolase [Microthrixaceae bacterium]|nr:N-formylglutamate amidohydrolase [Microthrixaceae bacterium]